MAGADGGEVAVVEGGDLGDGEAFGEGDDGGVDGAEGEVGVGGDEVGGAVEVRRGGFGELEVAGCEGAEELGFEPWAGLAGQQVADLGANRRTLSPWLNRQARAAVAAAGSRHCPAARCG